MGLKMREIGFQRTYIFKIFRGTMPPDPPRKVRLWRTITFSITYEHPLENLSYVPARTNQRLSQLQLQPRRWTDTSSSGRVCSRQRDRVSTDYTVSVYIIVEAVCFLCDEIYAIVITLISKIPCLTENIHYPFIHFLG